MATCIARNKRQSQALSMQVTPVWYIHVYVWELRSMWHSPCIALHMVQWLQLQYPSRSCHFAPIQMCTAVKVWRTDRCSLFSFIESRLTGWWWDEWLTRVPTRQLKNSPVTLLLLMNEVYTEWCRIWFKKSRLKYCTVQLLLLNCDAWPSLAVA